MGRVALTASSGRSGIACRIDSAANPFASNNDNPATPGVGRRNILRWLKPLAQEQERALKLFRTLLAAGAVATVSTFAIAADISGAGATFPYPVYAKWADDYKKATGIGLNYQSIGSGGGIKQIYAKTVTFGASDAPLT